MSEQNDNRTADGSDVLVQARLRQGSQLDRAFPKGATMLLILVAFLVVQGVVALKVLRLEKERNILERDVSTHHWLSKKIPALTEAANELEAAKGILQDDVRGLSAKKEDLQRIDLKIVEGKVKETELKKSLEILEIQLRELTGPTSNLARRTKEFENLVSTIEDESAKLSKEVDFTGKELKQQREGLVEGIVKLEEHTSEFAGLVEKMTRTTGNYDKSSQIVGATAEGIKNRSDALFGDKGELTNQVSALKSVVSDVKDKTGAVVSAMKMTSEELENGRTAVNKAHEVILKSLSATSQELSTSSGVLKPAVDSLKKTADTSVKSSDALKASSDALKSEVEKASGEEGSLNLSIKAINTSAKTVKETTDGMKTSVDAKLAVLEEQLNALKSVVSDVKDKTGAIVSAMKVTSEELESGRKAVEKANEGIFNALTETSQELSTSSGILKPAVDSFKKTADTSVKSSDILWASTDALKTEVERAAGEKGSLNLSIKAIDTSAKTVKETTDGMKTNVDAKLAELEKQIESLKEHSTTTEALLKRMDEQVSRISKSVSDTDASFTLVKDKSKLIDSQSERLLGENGTIRAFEQILQKRVKSLDELVAVLEKNIHAEVKELKDSFKSIQSDLGIVRKNVERLREKSTN